MIQTSAARLPLSTTPAAAPLRKRISTTELMQNERCIIIIHHGEEYLLRITKAGKLILTK